MLVELMIGAGVAGATFAIAKNKHATTGQSFAVAAITGVGAAVAWPLLLLGAIGAGGYLLVKRGQPKALPPGSSG